MTSWAITRAFWTRVRFLCMSCAIAIALCQWQKGRGHAYHARRLCARCQVKRTCTLGSVLSFVSADGQGLMQVIVLKKGRDKKKDKKRKAGDTLKFLYAVCVVL